MKIRFLQHFYNAWVLQKGGKSIVLTNSLDKDKASTKKSVAHVLSFPHNGL